MPRDYQHFYNSGYPQVGEMFNYAGYRAVLRFGQRQQKTGFIFEQMKKDYITETIKETKSNWRPRRSYYSKDAAYLATNKQSAVTFDQVQDVYSLLIN